MSLLEGAFERRRTAHPGLLPRIGLEDDDEQAVVRRRHEAQVLDLHQHLDGGDAHDAHDATSTTTNLLPGLSASSATTRFSAASRVSNALN